MKLIKHAACLMLAVLALNASANTITITSAASETNSLANKLIVALGEINNCASLSDANGRVISHLGLNVPAKRLNLGSAVKSIICQRSPLAPRDTQVTCVLSDETATTSAGCENTP